MVFAGLRDPGLHDGRLVRHRRRARSESGKYNKQVDLSFRWGMSWFIFSEVMFFARVLRRAVLHARALGALSWATSSSKLLWPDFNAGLARPGPGIAEQFTPMGAMGIPAHQHAASCSPPA